MSAAALTRWLDEYVAAGVIVTDSSLVIRWWNQWLERHTGVAASEAVGRPLFEVCPELCERNFDQYFKDALEGQVRLVSQSLHGHLLACPAKVRGGPGLMPQSARIVPLVEDGVIVGTLTSIHDVTERMETEDALRRQYEESERARRAAEEASNTKDAFLATLSHELRNPINAVIGWTSVLMSRGAHDRAVEVIDRNANLMMRMVDDMLDVARILTGKLSLDTVATDLSQVVTAAVDVVRPGAEARGITIDVASPEVISPFDADPVRLEQVFLNLLQNAVKFSTRGGRIGVTITPAGESVTVSISDTGQGISPDFLPHVFERFRQADASATRRHGGLGLGLALVSQLVELHGGTVRAHSDGVGRGATFEVTVPMTRASELVADAASLTTPAIAEALNSTRVLIVDDNQDIRGFVMAALSEHGAQVSEAASVSEALALIVASSGTPAVVLADIAMPDEDGYALLGRVRALQGDAGRTPVIALTGFGGPEQRAQLLERGFDDFIAKPFTPALLASVVARMALRASSPS
jgi:PAS domain S-box-containing protein